MRKILKLENNGAFRIAPSLKILSKNNYSSPQNTTISNCEPYFYISSHFTNHYAIPNFIKPSINPFQLSPPPPSTNSFLTQFERSHGRNPSRVTFLIKKKRKTTRSVLYILTSPWTLISNLKQFPISSWNRSENQSTASSKWKKREGGKNYFQPSQTLSNRAPIYWIYLRVLHQQVPGAWASVREPKHSWIEAIHCRESVVKIQRWTRKRKGAAGNESRHAQARSRGKVGKLVVGQQQVAQSRHNNNNDDDDDFFSF